VPVKLSHSLLPFCSQRFLHVPPSVKRVALPGRAFLFAWLSSAEGVSGESRLPPPSLLSGVFPRPCPIAADNAPASKVNSFRCLFPLSLPSVGPFSSFHSFDIGCPPPPTRPCGFSLFFHLSSRSFFFPSIRCAEPNYTGFFPLGFMARFVDEAFGFPTSVIHNEDRFWFFLPFPSSFLIKKGVTDRLSLVLQKIEVPNWPPPDRLSFFAAPKGSLAWSPRPRWLIRDFSLCPSPCFSSLQQVDPYEDLGGPPPSFLREGLSLPQHPPPGRVLVKFPSLQFPLFPFLGKIFLPFSRQLLDLRHLVVLFT